MKIHIHITIFCALFLCMFPIFSMDYCVLVHPPIKNIVRSKVVTASQLLFGTARALPEPARAEIAWIQGIVYSCIMKTLESHTNKIGLNQLRAIEENLGPAFAFALGQYAATKSQFALEALADLIPNPEIITRRVEDQISSEVLLASKSIYCKPLAGFVGKELSNRIKSIVLAEITKLDR